MRVAIRNWLLAAILLALATALAAPPAHAQGDAQGSTPAPAMSLPASLAAPLAPNPMMKNPDAALLPEPTDDNTYKSQICPGVDAKAEDRPDDLGGSIRVSWKPCPKEGVPSPSTWIVLRAEKTDSAPAFVEAGRFSANDEHLKSLPKQSGDLESTYVFDDEDLADGRNYVYRVLGQDGGRSAYSFIAAGDIPLVNIGPATPERQVFAYASRESLRGSFTGAAPTDVVASDRANDSGEEIHIEWKVALGADPIPGITYHVFSSTKADGDYKAIGSVGGTKTAFEYKEDDLDKLTKKNPLFFAVAAVAANGADMAVSERTAEPVSAKMQIINRDEWNFVLFALGLSGFILYFIQHIKSGKKLFVRKIAGLEAVEESIGRATEMGKPVLYIPGIMDMNDVMTVSAIVILGRIARQVAEYDTKLLVPTSKSLVMTTGRETVKEAFISAGRPDAYNDNIVTYLTDEQFGYVAGVNGIMVREKPATCIYFGAFFAESLILAETGNSIGAIQIAGTAQAAQLPFFIAACDYTLIGEELFAASAYLSHDPKQLGSLKGQDMGKLAGMAGIVAGGIFATLAQLSGAGWAGAVTDAIIKLFTPIGG